MRRSFELAFATAYLFGGDKPRFLEVDDISFDKPVDVGDLLVFKVRESARASSAVQFDLKLSETVRLCRATYSTHVPMEGISARTSTTTRGCRSCSSRSSAG